jgi:hypothetical protein
MSEHSRDFIRPALLLAVFCSLTSARGQIRTAEALPHDYPGYHILRLTERDADTRAFLVQHFKTSDASVVHADFNGDGNLDYAMLLKSDTSPAAKLVVLLCDGQHKCRSVYEQDITGYSNEAYLSPLPIGSRVAVAGSVEGEQPPPVKLTAVGIQVTYFEKGQGALYWDKKLKKIVEVGTGE